MTYTRKSFSGNAVPTTLAANIGISDTTIQVNSVLGWPNTSNGPFIIVIDRGLTGLEEKILIASYTGTTLTVASGGRGSDGTTAVAHTANADVRHTIDAGTINNHETFVAANGTVAPTASAVGDASSNGTSAAPAAADHKHAREAFAAGATAASAPGDAENDGTSASPARADHKHARESVATLVSDISPFVIGLPLDIAGATAPTRYAGGTAAGAPSSGTFQTGDYVIDQTGHIFVCTVGGTPGTWVSITAALAPLASPALTGTPTAPTGAANDNSTQIATDAFVQSAKQSLSLYDVDGSIGGSPPARLTGNFYQIAGSSVVTTNGAGGAAITFAHQFPSGILTFVAMAGDDSQPELTVTGINAQASSLGFGFIVYQGTSPYVGVVRINWIAIGW